ncbi:hypothetical protein WN943_015483 [Citrus x changshan-huyou]
MKVVGRNKRKECEIKGGTEVVGDDAIIDGGRKRQCCNGFIRYFPRSATSLAVGQNFLRLPSSSSDEDSIRESKGLLFGELKFRFIEKP